MEDARSAAAVAWLSGTARVEAGRGAGACPEGGIERVRRTNLYRVEQVADLPFIGRDDALQHRAPGARAARNQQLLIDGGSGRDHVRLVGRGAPSERANP